MSVFKDVRCMKTANVHDLMFGAVPTTAPRATVEALYLSSQNLKTLNPKHLLRIS